MAYGSRAPSNPKGHLTQRADDFAKKMVGQPPVEDTRSVDEKLAEFHKTWEPSRVRDARSAVKAI